MAISLAWTDSCRDYECTVFMRNDVGNPGYADLRTVGANDAIGSFICYD